MEWLNRIMGRKTSPRPPAEDQTARLAYLPKEFAEHPGSNLTPARAASLLREAEQGNLRALADLADDMEERDTHLFAELMKRRRACIGADWKLELRNPDNAEQKAIEQLTEWLQDLPMADLLWDKTDAIHKGYSCTEMAWEYADKVWLPRQFQHRPAAWFMANPEQRDTLLLRGDTGAGEALQEHSWITHIHKARSGYLTSTALARVTVWPYLFRAFSSRDFAEFLEIYGLPLRLGRYPSGSTAEERSTLLRAVTAIGHSAAGILPANMAIEFQAAAEGQADPYMAMVAWAERGISKAILGGTLTSEVDGKGSYAAASVHDDVRLELRSADLRMLGNTLTRDLIRPLVLFNTGLTRVPRLVFDDTAPEDLQLFADALPKLAGVMPIPLGWAQSKLKIPAPNGDEPILQAAGSAPTGTAATRMVASNVAPVTGCACCGGESMAALKTTGATSDVQSGIDNATPDDLQQHAEILLQPLIDRALQGVRDGESADSLLLTLMAGYPELDSRAVETALTQAVFIADLAGRWEAQQDITRGRT